MTKTSYTREQIDTLLTALVAAFPGATLTRDADGRPHGFKLQAEEAVWLAYDSHKHRLHVHGCWPHSRIPGELHKRFGPWDIHPRPDDTTISICAERAANAARTVTEINRRFLPAYRSVLAKCLERRAAHEGYVNSTKSLAAEIAGIFGTRAGENGNVDLPGGLNGGRDFYGDVSVAGDSVKFELRSLNREQAIELAQLVKSFVSQPV